MTRIIKLVLALMFAVPCARAGMIGEVGVAGGVMTPQGTYAQYADPGAMLLLRINGHPKSIPILSSWLSAGGAFFGSEERAVLLTAPGTSNPPLPAKQTISDDAFTLHLGVQLGSWTRRGFFRPRAAIAPGIYAFSTHTKVRPLDYTEDLMDDTESLVRLGWRGVIGTDLFFARKWGISIDFVYDHVQSMQNVVETDQSGLTKVTSRPARYQTIMVGAVIPLEFINQLGE